MEEFAQQYEAILFDFDGTLTPSLPLWCAAFNYALGQFGKHVSDEEIIAQCFYRSWQDIVAGYSISSVPLFQQYVQDGLELAFVNAGLFEGTVEVLKHCQKQGVKLGIVTSSERKLVSEVLLKNGVTDYFLTVVTSDDVTNHKPHPEPVLLCLERLQCQAEDCLLIGDSLADMLAARAVGMQHALFFPDEHHKFYSFEKLVETEPHFVFRHFKEILTHLDKLATGPLNRASC